MKPSKRKRDKQPRKKRQNQLERDTAAYFENMTEEELQEEREMGKVLSNTPRGIDPDSKPRRGDR
jgi:hypothetical protein